MIEYHTMQEADVTQVAALEAVCFHDPWSEKSIQSELTNPLSCWIVAQEAEKIVGYVGSQTVLDESDMMNIAVSPAYRRHGIAEHLVQTLIDALRARGSHALTLEVRASNAPAQALYKKLAFQQIGLRKNYYRNPKEDAMILRKEWEI